jgi:hypothetical protein
MLTPENWEENTQGKTVFLAFVEPLCMYCQKLKPIWKKIVQQFEGTDTFFGLVDCKGDGKPICDDNRVKTFPGVMHGDPSNLDRYHGDRDFESLKTLVENLKPTCSISNMDVCNDEKKTQIKQYKKMTAEELDASIAEAEKLLDEAEKDLEKKVEKLNDKYSKLKEKNLSDKAMKKEVAKIQKAFDRHDKTMTDSQTKIKEAGYTMMKAVKRSKAYVNTGNTASKTDKDEL